MFYTTKTQIFIHTYNFSPKEFSYEQFSSIIVFKNLRSTKSKCHLMLVLVDCSRASLQSLNFSFKEASKSYVVRLFKNVDWCLLDPPKVVHFQKIQHECNNDFDQSKSTSKRTKRCCALTKLTTSNRFLLSRTLCLRSSS